MRAVIPRDCHPGRTISAFMRVCDALWREPGSIYPRAPERGKPGSRLSQPAAARPGWQSSGFCD